MVPAIYKVISLAELVALSQMQIYQAHGIRAIVEGETVWVPDAVLLAMVDTPRPEGRRILKTFRS
jgi:hypothetical protein